MPLSDIATAQSCFHNKVYKLGTWNLRDNFVNGNDASSASLWKSIGIPQKTRNLNFGRGRAWRGGLMIRAVATIEKEQTMKLEVEQHGREFQGMKMGVDTSSSLELQQLSSTEDFENLEEREKVRRLKISKANKGNTPWNKGKKHSPETLQRIRERTRIAMQDPKVKMKLVSLGHAQSQETRAKIGVGVRMRWEKRREKLLLQETCHYEWQNLIAEASRRGLLGEEELKWDSYNILNEQLEVEWRQSIEERRIGPKVKNSKRAPKSAEQRRKISEAIAAKWADPAYRSRVRCGLAKYHGTVDSAERSRRRKLSGDSETRKRSPPKKKEATDDSRSEQKHQMQRARVKKSSVVKYKDPLAVAKLEMLKNIRAERAAVEDKKTEAVMRAKILIAEAERAAKALETAATTSPIAHASLIETRKLIAEAVQSLESIEEGDISPPEDNAESPANSVEPRDHFGGHSELGGHSLDHADERKVNGKKVMGPNDHEVQEFNINNIKFQEIVNGKDQVMQSDFYDSALVNGKKGLSALNLDGSSPEKLHDFPKCSSFRHGDDGIELNGKAGQVQEAVPEGLKSEPKQEETLSKPLTTPKKWLRGKLVEISGEDV